MNGAQAQSTPNGAGCHSLLVRRPSALKTVTPEAGTLSFWSTSTRERFWRRLARSGHDEELNDRGTERIRKLLKHGDGRVLQPAFEAAYVGSIDTGISGEGLLRKAASDPEPPEISRHKCLRPLPMFNNIVQPVVRGLAQSSVKEEGVLRYDIYEEPAPHANHYSVVAAWANAKAFDAHETAAHTREFRAATAMPARGNLYDQRLYKVVD